MKPDRCGLTDSNCKGPCTTLDHKSALGPPDVRSGCLHDQLKESRKQKLINLLFRENDRAEEMAHGIKALAI